jgi:hypothetical protein
LLSESLGINAEMIVTRSEIAAQVLQSGKTVRIIIIRRAVKKLSDERLNWHPGFVEGLMAEFDEYADGLEFLSEYQLSKEPLRIDVVVIRKRPEIVIEKDVGRIFRGHNIFEYKSPTDYVSVANFQKVCAYAWLYAAENGVCIDDITLSFVSARRPDTVIAYCTDALGYLVEEAYPGVYYVSGGFAPMQLIESRKLSGDENLWLRNLRDDISAQELEKLLELLAARGGADKRKAYLNAILVANADRLREVRNMYMTQELRDVILEIGLFDDLLEARERDGKQIGEQIGEQRGKEIGKQIGAINVLNLLDQGYSADEIRKMVDSGGLPKLES